jgi:hypothetical protein
VITRVTNVTNRIANDFSEGVGDAGAGLTDALNNISDSDSPLSSGAGSGAGSWALINLLLAIAGIATVIALFIVLPRRREDDEERRSPLWIILSLAAAAVGAAFFLITQNLSGGMILVDGYTIIQAVIFVLALAGSLAAVMTGRRTDSVS